MNERSYASLSSGLLARKGAAKPAMRPQAYGSLEDLGWNDMGYAPVAEQPEPAPIPEHVPSPITALTPAPRPGEVDPEAFYGEEEEGDTDAFEPVEEMAAPVEAQSAPVEEAVEPVEELAEPVEELAEPVDAPAEPVAAQPDTAQEDYSVVAQQRAILERFDGAHEPEEDFEPEPEPMVPARKPRAAKAEVVPMPRRAAPTAAAAGGRKSAFTLRLDQDRHLRLRLACAVTGRSAQQIVTGALDAALAGIPEIEALAARVPAKAGSAGAKRN